MVVRGGGGGGGRMPPGPTLLTERDRDGDRDISRMFFGQKCQNECVRIDDTTKTQQRVVLVAARGVRGGRGWMETGKAEKRNGVSPPSRVCW